MSNPIFIELTIGSNCGLGFVGNCRKSFVVLILVWSRLIGNSVGCGTGAELVLHFGEFD
jgi:hypothetical protein